MHNENTEFPIFPVIYDFNRIGEVGSLSDANDIAACHSSIPCFIQQNIPTFFHFNYNETEDINQLDTSSFYLLIPEHEYIIFLNKENEIKLLNAFDAIELFDADPDLTFVLSPTVTIFDDIVLNHIDQNKHLFVYGYLSYTKNELKNLKNPS